MAATNYVWDPVFDCITHEIDDAGNVIAEYTHEPKLHGQLISQHRGGVSSFHHYDAMGTTRALTDSNQNVTDTAVYTAFGEKVASTGSTVNPFGYVGALGYYTSPTTADAYVRGRTYSPEVARWLNVDPLKRLLRASSAVMDSYVYVANSPLRYVDPSGLTAEMFNGKLAEFSSFTLYANDSIDVGDPENPENYKGCTAKEKEAIRAAALRVCRELFDKCKKGTGLEDCFDDLCSAKQGRQWEIKCDKCTDERPDVCGYTSIGNDIICAGDAKKCKAIGFKERNITFCRGSEGEIPHLGCSLEGIWIHEMLHNCCLNHLEKSPPWEKEIFDSCVAKCLEGKDDGKCKCPGGKDDPSKPKKC